MFYSRQQHKPPLLRFLIMFVIATGLALYFLWVDLAYDRAGVMAVAALLSGGYLVWQARQYDSLQAVRAEILRTLRDVWR